MTTSVSIEINNCMGYSYIYGGFTCEKLRSYKYLFDNNGKLKSFIMDYDGNIYNCIYHYLSNGKISYINWKSTYENDTVFFDNQTNNPKEKLQDTTYNFDSSYWINYYKAKYNDENLLIKEEISHYTIEDSIIIDYTYDSNDNLISKKYESLKDKETIELLYGGYDNKINYFNESNKIMGFYHFKIPEALSKNNPTYVLEKVKNTTDTFKTISYQYNQYNKPILIINKYHNSSIKDTIKIKYN